MTSHRAAATLAAMTKQGDLFSRMLRDAGRAVPHPAHSDPRRASGAPPCTACGAPLPEGLAGACLQCAWSGRAGDRPAWSHDPADASVLGSYRPRTTPFLHQLSALAGLRGRVRALLMEMGTGKTKVIIDDWAMRVEAGQLRDLVIIAPRGAYRNWEGVRPSGVPGELGIHLPEDLLDRAAVATWVSGSPAARRRVEWLLQLRDPRRLRVLLINVEALSRVDAALEAAKAMASSRQCLVVVDESTRIRTETSQRTQAVLDIGFSAPEQFRRIMTGLPTPRSPLDLYSQFMFLSWKILGFRSFFAFRNRYAVTRTIQVQTGKTNALTGAAATRNQQIVVGYRNVAELREKIEPWSFRVTKDECLDLPPKIYELHEVELTRDQERHYSELRTVATTQLESGAWVTAPEILPRLIRMQQVLCGFVQDEEGVVHDVESNRLDELMEVVGDSSGKAIIWAPYIRSLRDITERLRREYGQRSTVRFWGEVRDAERLEAVERFQRDDTCRYFVGNPATAGMSITLTAASLVVYYANSPDLEHRLQSEDRPHRAGLDHHVTYVDLCAMGTIDWKWIRTLRRKIDIASTITGDVARSWLV